MNRNYKHGKQARGRSFPQAYGESLQLQRSCTPVKTTASGLAVRKQHDEQVYFQRQSMLTGILLMEEIMVAGLEDVLELSSRLRIFDF